MINDVSCLSISAETLSDLVRNFAVSGKSAIIQNEAIAHNIVARPSRINIQAHPGRPPTPFMFSIAAASKPPAGLIRAGD